MKRILSMVLSVCMIMSLTSCGYKLVKVDDEPSTSMTTPGYIDSGSTFTFTNDPQQVEPAQVSYAYPEPDPETSDMWTFYADDLHNMSAQGFSDFYRDFKDQRVRIAYEYLGTEMDSGVYYVSTSNSKFRYEIDKDYYEDPSLFDPEMSDWVIEATLTGNSGGNLYFSDTLFYLDVDGEWWKDDYEIDDGYGDFYDEPATVLTNFEEFYNNEYRYIANHYDGEYTVVKNVMVSSIYENYLTVRDDWFRLGTFYYIYDDINSSNAINLDEGDYINIYGYFDADSPDSWDGFTLRDCSFTIVSKVQRPW